MKTGWGVIMGKAGVVYPIEQTKCTPGRPVRKNEHAALSHVGACCIRRKK
jgi:hypothetical protein